MAKTRGGKVARHRQRANAQAHVVNDHEEPQEVLVNAYANSQALGSFPGGPEDFSVLRHFSNHVATRLWNKEGRTRLGLSVHFYCYLPYKANGRKVKNENEITELFDIMSNKVNRIV
ncbi:hypothetical protein JHK82_036047 [Glycine max]|nr:hypothetical protein JHK85_036780 [Glycine max]KAG5112778.1 hypothetical protein JHK82_036047 [Glycine max]